LVHNIFHEKQHTGQVWNIRDELRLLQGWDDATLYPLLVDYYLSRAQMIASLFGLTDEQLDAIPPEGGWTVRQTLEHALGSERRSISALRAEFVQSTAAQTHGDR
jgi:DinB superfamily